MPPAAHSALASSASTLLNQAMFDMQPNVGPGTSGPHEFVQRPHSSDLASVMGGSMVMAGAPVAFGITLRIAEQERRPICALPGCGRERDDPIHGAPEPPER